MRPVLQTTDAQSGKRAPVHEGCAIGFGNGLRTLAASAAAGMAVGKGTQRFPSPYCARVKKFPPLWEELLSAPPFPRRGHGGHGRCFPVNVAQGVTGDRMGSERAPAASRTPFF